MSESEDVADLRARLLGLVGADAAMSPDRKSELFRIARDAIAYAQELVTVKNDLARALEITKQQVARGDGFRRTRGNIIVGVICAVAGAVATAYATYLLTRGAH